MNKLSGAMSESGNVWQRQAFVDSTGGMLILAERNPVYKVMTILNGYDDDESVQQAILKLI